MQDNLSLKKGEYVDCEIESLAFGGEGVARIHDFVVFIQCAIPGQRVKALITKKKPRYAQARAIEILRESPFAVNPACNCLKGGLFKLGVILATGGSCRLHIGGFPTTNHYGATGDGLGIGYRAGVSVCFLHTTQYHPTGAFYPEQADGLLISEKFRGAGVHLVNIDGEQFVCETEPRDACASSIIRECTQIGKGIFTPTGKIGVWLDTPMVDLLHGEGVLIKEFVGKYKLFKRYGIDITKEPILVYPTLHYQNGGLKFNEQGETSIPGLYAAGEVTGGVHGENRLGGNSLMDVLVFGRIAGRNATLFARERAREGRLTLDYVRKFHKELKEAGIDRGKVSPVLLPDYSNPLVRQRQLTTLYQGTIR